MKINPTYLVILLVVIIFGVIETFLNLGTNPPPVVNSNLNVAKTTTVNNKPKPIVNTSTSTSTTLVYQFLGFALQQIGSTSESQNIEKQYEFKVVSNYNGNITGNITLNCDYSIAHCSYFETLGLNKQYIVEAKYDPIKNWFLIQNMHLSGGDQ